MVFCGAAKSKNRDFILLYGRLVKNKSSFVVNNKVKLPESRLM